MIETHQTPAIVTSMNINGLAVARVLGRHGVPVIGIHENRTDPETLCGFLDELWHRDGSLIELLMHQGTKFADRPVLVPITDEAVRVIAEHLEDLRSHYRVSMPEPSTVQRLIDKQGFDEWARELEGDLSLPLPRTWIVECPEDLDEVAASATFPCILKPPEKSAAFELAGGKKAYVLEDVAVLRSVYEQFREVQPRVIVQQYIPGGDDEVYFCLLACGEDHEPLATFTGRKLRQWRPHCGGTASAEPVDEPQLTELTTAFFRRVGMVGACSMEFKRDPRDGAFYLIEPTVCRTDWQNGLADANGAPIAYVAYRAALGLPTIGKPKPWLRRRWVEFGTDRLAAHYYRERGELGRLAWLWSIRPPVRGAYFALDDLKPFLRILRRTLRRVRQKVGLGGTES
jgi:D-aspartate ligase